MALDPRGAALALHRFGFGRRAGTLAAIASDPRGARSAISTGPMRPDSGCRFDERPVAVSRMRSDLSPNVRPSRKLETRRREAAKQQVAKLAAANPVMQNPDMQNPAMENAGMEKPADGKSTDAKAPPRSLRP